MAENRVSKYLLEQEMLYGKDWVPEDDIVKMALVERCATLMEATLLDVGMIAQHSQTHDRMIYMASVLVEFSLLCSTNKDVTFLSALGIAMGTVATMAVNEIVVIGKLRKS